jgi:hypothetical protein
MVVRTWPAASAAMNVRRRAECFIALSALGFESEVFG